MTFLFLLPRLSPNVGGAVGDGRRGKGAWGAGGARGRSGVLIGRPTVIVVLTPASYIMAFISFYAILELSPVPCCFPMKDTAKARPRRRPSPSSSPNNIEAFRKAITAARSQQ